MSRFDVCVLGAGMAGLATAWHLGRAGVRTVVLEREAAPFRHSSGLNAGILRTVVENEALGELAARGSRALLEPDPALSRSSFVDRVGLLLVADDERSARELGRMTTFAASPVFEVEPTEVAERVPHVRPREHVAAFHLPEEGTIDLEALSHALIEGVRSSGGEIRPGTTALEITTRDGRARAVRTESGSIEAGTVVVAAGGWAGDLGAAAGSRVRLAPTRRHAARARVARPVDPTWPVYWNLGDPFYTRPLGGDLMVCDCDQVPIEPDACAVDRGAVERLRDAANRHLADAYAPVELDTWCAMRTFGDGHVFTLGPDPDVEGLVWAADSAATGSRPASRSVGWSRSPRAVSTTSVSVRMRRVVPGEGGRRCTPAPSAPRNAKFTRRHRTQRPRGAAQGGAGSREPTRAQRASDRAPTIVVSVSSVAPCEFPRAARSGARQSPARPLGRASRS
ncbi:MAG: FAD-dependent oxidoreductase [Planctomycetota bacterium]